jgi:hypothetical protein
MAIGRKKLPQTKNNELDLPVITSADVKRSKIVVTKTNICFNDERNLYSEPADWGNKTCLKLKGGKPNIWR